MSNEPDIIEDDETETPDPALADSYWTHGRKNVKEGWQREVDGTKSSVFVTDRGRFGAELNVTMRPSVGSDVPMFQLGIAFLLTQSDMGQMVRTLVGQILRVAKGIEDDGEERDQLWAVRDILLNCLNAVESRWAELSGIGDEPE